MAIDRKAINKARSRIRTAEKAIEALHNSADHTEFSDNWYVFLVASKNIYTALEQGVKSSPQDRQWFGGKKDERRQDELLQYLFQARNDDEHGLNEVTKLDHGGFALAAEPGSSSSYTIDYCLIQNGKVKMQATPHDGLPIVLKHTPKHTKLAPVTGPGPVIYNPPRTHLGRDLETGLPIEVANLCLSYLKKLVEEAEARE